MQVNASEKTSKIKEKNKKGSPCAGLRSAHHRPRSSERVPQIRLAANGRPRRPDAGAVAGGRGAQNPSQQKLLIRKKKKKNRRPARKPRREPFRRLTAQRVELGVLRAKAGPKGPVRAWRRRREAKPHKGAASPPKTNKTKKPAGARLPFASLQTGEGKTGAEGYIKSLAMVAEVGLQSLSPVCGVRVGGGKTARFLCFFVASPVLLPSMGKEPSNSRRAASPTRV